MRPARAHARAENYARSPPHRAPRKPSVRFAASVGARGDGYEKPPETKKQRADRLRAEARRKGVGK